jgi:hypothetical protein
MSNCGGRKKMKDGGKVKVERINKKGRTEAVERALKALGAMKQGDIQAKYPSKGTREEKRPPQFEKHRDPGAVERMMEFERSLREAGFRDGGPVGFKDNTPPRDYDAEAREEAEFRAKLDADAKKEKKRQEMVKSLPRSMKKHLGKHFFDINAPTVVKENRKPKTKEERAGGKNPTDEQRLQARFLEDDRKRFETKVQNKMGSFKDGGSVCSGARSAVRGKKFSGIY